MINYILLVIYIWVCGWVGGCIYLYIFVYILLYIHTYTLFFYKFMIVKSIETFVVCAVSRIKLILLLLLLLLLLLFWGGLKRFPFSHF